VAGVLSFEDAVRAVVRRAELMEEACQAQAGTMAALMGLEEQQVQEICDQASAKGVVAPANFNSRIQIAVSGSKAAVEYAVELAKEAGAKRAMLLEVGGAFHSPLMEPARRGLAEFLTDVDFNAPQATVIANVTAKPVSGPDEVRDLLVRQVTSPVRWSQTMAYLTAHGVDRIIEIGPGRVLSGLAKRDMQPEQSITLDTLFDIESFTMVTA